MKSIKVMPWLKYLEFVAQFREICCVGIATACECMFNTAQTLYNITIKIYSNGLNICHFKEKCCDFCCFTLMLFLDSTVCKITVK